MKKKNVPWMITSTNPKLMKRGKVVSTGREKTQYDSPRQEGDEKRKEREETSGMLLTCKPTSTCFPPTKKLEHFVHTEVMPKVSHRKQNKDHVLFLFFSKWHTPRSNTTTTIYLFFVHVKKKKGETNMAYG